jgi:hypothetical protein
VIAFLSSAVFVVFLVAVTLSLVLRVFRTFRARAVALGFALALFALPALAQLDGNTVITILPISDRAKANIAFGWLGLYYLAGLLKRWIPSHTIVGKALDAITQDTRPPSVPAP